VAPDVRSYFAVPLVADGRAIGLLQIDSAQPDAWSETQRGVLLAVAPIVAAAIHASRAYAQANAARTRADNAERRLAEVRELVALIRVCADARDEEALQRHLDRLEALAGDAALPRPDLRLPTPRVAVS
jgi:GAF domain-containing protein